MSKPLPKTRINPANVVAGDRRAWLMSDAFTGAVVDHFARAKRAAIEDLHAAGLPTHTADDTGAVVGATVSSRG